MYDHHLQSNFLQEISRVPQRFDLQIEDKIGRWRVWFSENLILVSRLKTFFFITAAKVNHCNRKTRQPSLIFE